jgi:hypothetical protein
MFQNGRFTRQADSQMLSCADKIDLYEPSGHLEGYPRHSDHLATHASAIAILSNGFRIGHERRRKSPKSGASARTSEGMSTSKARAVLRLTQS